MTLIDHPGVLFILPRALGRLAAVYSPWLAGAQFARALGNRLGGAEILTPAGLLSPEEAAGRAVLSVTAPSAGRTVIRRVPRSVRLAVGDIRTLRSARRMRTSLGMIAGKDYQLVVQMHARFHDLGLSIARRSGAPFVLRVEALEVREEAAWGLPRPGFGRLVERRGELRLMRTADLVASVSEVVDRQLQEAGISGERRVVIPNGVDLEAFSPGEPDPELRRNHGLEGRFLVGWIGGFRPFHGLDLIPDVARGLAAVVPEATLCLLGTGPLRDNVAHRVEGLGDLVRLLPPVAHSDVSRWLRTFDVCLLLAGPGEFHYSPLKLYEYLGCGRPVVAARVGDVPRILGGGRVGMLVPPGDAGAVVSALHRLAKDRALRAELGRAARRTAESSGSWDARAGELLDALRARNLHPRVRPRRPGRGSAESLG